MQRLQIYPQSLLQALLVLLSRAIPLQKSSGERSGQEYLETSVKNSDKHSTVTRSSWDGTNEIYHVVLQQKRVFFLFLHFSFKMDSLVSRYRKMPLQITLGVYSACNQCHKLTPQPSLVVLWECCFPSAHI